MSVFNDANDLTRQLYYSEAYQDAKVKYPPYKSLTLRRRDGAAELTATITRGKTHEEWVQAANEVEELLWIGYFPAYFTREDGGIENLQPNSFDFIQTTIDDL